MGGECIEVTILYSWVGPKLLYRSDDMQDAHGEDGGGRGSWFFHAIIDYGIFLDIISILVSTFVMASEN